MAQIRLNDGAWTRSHITTHRNILRDSGGRGNSNSTVIAPLIDAQNLAVTLPSNRSCTVGQRITILSDIAGRVALATVGSARVTGAAVAVRSADAQRLREELGAATPKWGTCNFKDAFRVMDLLRSNALAVSVHSINKDTDAWRKLAIDMDVLQGAIAGKSRPHAGFAKPSNILAFHLIGGACAMATAHATRRLVGVQAATNSEFPSMEFSTVCDSDISGAENLEVFKSMWRLDAQRASTYKARGLEVTFDEVSVVDEQQEPLLLLADYAAGIAHAALLEDHGRLKMPLGRAKACSLLDKLDASGALVVRAVDFDVSAKEIFGSLMASAEAMQGA